MAAANTSIPWMEDAFSTTWRAFASTCSEQFAVFRLLLGVPLLGRHPFQFQHAAASAARAIGEAFYPARQNLMEVLDQARNRAHCIPQQGSIGRKMNIGFYYAGIDP